MTLAKELLEARILAYLEEYDCYCTDDEQDRKNLASGLAERLTAKPEPQPKVVIRKVNDKERKVLEHLAEDFDPIEWRAWYIRGLAKASGLTEAETRRACRSLAKKGLAQYERGLFNEDGEAAGSGYRATEEGAALISHCDLCDRRNTYEYHLDKNGKHDWEKGYDEASGRLIKECDQHYQQSAANPPMTQGTLA